MELLPGSKGLITREHVETDRRQVYLMLTPQGESMLAKLSVMRKEQLQRKGQQIEALLKILRGSK